MSDGDKIKTGGRDWQPQPRKFDIAKVAGSATNLAFIDDDDRAFEERSLPWEVRLTVHSWHSIYNAYIRRS